MRGSTEFRWRLADDDGGQPALFAEEELVHRHVGIGAYAGLEFLHVNAKSIITTVPEQSRVPFRHTINAYRGCSHACTYCFARPTHEYLGLGIGEDFERTLVVKVNAVERVRAELRAKRWRGEFIAMGTNTDPYQRAEGKYHLTAGIIDELAEVGNPFSILTKSTLILRDLDRLVAAAGRCRGPVQLLHRHPRPRRLEGHRTGHPPSPPTRRSGPPAERRRHPHRRSHRPHHPRPVRQHRTARGGDGRLPRRRGRLGDPVGPPSAAGGEGALPVRSADQTAGPGRALQRRYRRRLPAPPNRTPIIEPVTRTVARLQPVAPPPRRWHPDAARGG